MDQTPILDFMSLAKDVGIPLISGAAGVVIALWQSTIQLRQDIRDVRQHQEHDIKDRESLKALIDTALQTSAQQVVKIALIEQQLSTLQLDSKAHETALYAFTKEQAESWLEVTRTLAGIEQILKGRAGQKRPLQRRMPRSFRRCEPGRAFELFEGRNVSPYCPLEISWHSPRKTT